MSIPQNIHSYHILAVIHQIDAGSLKVPPNQRSTGYCIVYNGKHYTHYPPKYLVREANRIVNGYPLWTHYGGKETNGFLKSRGFEWTDCGGAPH